MQKKQPVARASVTIDSNTTATDNNGHFELVIPGGQLGSELLMQVQASGFAPVSTYVVPNANPATISLQPNP